MDVERAWKKAKFNCKKLQLKKVCIIHFTNIEPQSGWWYNDFLTAMNYTFNDHFYFSINLPYNCYQGPAWAFANRQHFFDSIFLNLIGRNMHYNFLMYYGNILAYLSEQRQKFDSVIKFNRNARFFLLQDFQIAWQFYCNINWTTMLIMKACTTSYYRDLFIKKETMILIYIWIL